MDTDELRDAWLSSLFSYTNTGFFSVCGMEADVDKIFSLNFYY